jgi:hypothetical protein
MVLLDSYYAPGHRTKFPEEAALAVPLAAAAIGSSLRAHVAEALALPLTCVRLTKGGIRVADDSALAEGDVVRLLPMLPASCAFAGRRVVRPRTVPWPPVVKLGLSRAEEASVLTARAAGLCGLLEDTFAISLVQKPQEDLAPEKERPQRRNSLSLFSASPDASDEGNRRGSRAFSTRGSLLGMARTSEARQHFATVASEASSTAGQKEPRRPTRRRTSWFENVDLDGEGA